MQRYRGYLSALGHVHTFDYDYMAAGRRLPDRQDQLLLRHQQQLETVLRRTEGPDVVLVGKSMGSRIGCHLAAQAAQNSTSDENSFYRRIRAIICLGYPLVSSGKTKDVRDAVLYQLRTPTLFVQGTRDKLCPLEQLTAVSERMTCKRSVHVVPSGDHSLLATKTYLKKHDTSQVALEQGVVNAIKSFISGCD